MACLVTAAVTVSIDRMEHHSTGPSVTAGKLTDRSGPATFRGMPNRNFSTPRRPLQVSIDVTRYGLSAPSGDKIQPAEAPGKVVLRGKIYSGSEDSSGFGKVVLSSLSHERVYRTFSGSNGEFVIENINPARDYQLRITPGGVHQQQVVNGLILTEPLVTLSITLPEPDVALLTGVILGPEGNAVAGQGVRVRSPEYSQWASHFVSDSAGRFRVENVPVGELEFSSTFGPAMRSIGHRFDGETSTDLVLRINHGSHELRGLVFDRYYNLVEGARVSLDWQSSDHGAISVISRHVTTGSEGQFRLEGIGPGEHELIVSGAHGAIHRQTVEIDGRHGDLTIVLASTAPGY